MLPSRPRSTWRKAFAALLPLFALLFFKTACTDVYVRRQRQGVVLFRIPPKAHVYLNGTFLGIGATVNRRPYPLRVGKHKLVILDSDYYPYYSTFSLKSGDLLKRRVILYRRLDE